MVCHLRCSLRREKILPFQKTALKHQAAAAHFLKRQHFCYVGCLLGSDGFHRADIDAGAAVNAFFKVDHVLVGTL